MNDDRADVLELLIRHELTIMNLYKVFAGLYSDVRDFWESLAREEQRHADLLAGLRDNQELDRRRLLDSRMKPQAITLSIGYAEGRIALAQEGVTTLLEALSIARDLESSLIEKQLSHINASVPPAARSVFEELAADTERHRKTITEELERERLLNA